MEETKPEGEEVGDAVKETKEEVGDLNTDSATKDDKELEKPQEIDNYSELVDDSLENAGGDENEEEINEGDDEVDETADKKIVENVEAAQKSDEPSEIPEEESSETPKPVTETVEETETKEV